MAKELTPQQQAERLYIEAAILLHTKPRPHQIRRAVRLVLLRGYRPVDAAKVIGRPRQHVNRAVALIRKSVEEMKRSVIV